MNNWGVNPTLTTYFYLFVFRSLKKYDCVRKRTISMKTILKMLFSTMRKYLCIYAFVCLVYECHFRQWLFLLFGACLFYGSFLLVRFLWALHSISYNLNAYIVRLWYSQYKFSSFKQFRLYIKKLCW